MSKHPEKSYILITAEHLPETRFSPEEFRMLIQAASVGLEGYQMGDETADALWEKIQPLDAAA